MKYVKFVAGGLLILAAIGLAAVFGLGGPSAIAAGTDSIWTLVGLTSSTVLVFLLGVRIVAGHPGALGARL